jgi:hypothetical protein
MVVKVGKIGKPNKKGEQGPFSRKQKPPSETSKVEEVFEDS